MIAPAAEISWCCAPPETTNTTPTCAASAISIPWRPSIIPNRDAAVDPFVSDAIKHASAIFIAGGDQANYINFWMNTPVQTALNDAIRRGVPIGGTSAGLAVMGEYIYTAQGDKPDDPNLDGKTALADPYSARIRLAQNFLSIPILKNIVTDTHFATARSHGTPACIPRSIQRARRKRSASPHLIGQGHRNRGTRSSVA